VIAVRTVTTRPVAKEASSDSSDDSDEESDYEETPLARPLMEITVAGRVYLGLLDEGASHSFMSAPIAVRAKEGAARTTTEHTLITGWGGRTSSSEAIFTTVKWEGGEVIQKFLVTKEEKGDSIILGRSFFQNAKVFPDMQAGGWHQSRDGDKIHPFAAPEKVVCLNVSVTSPESAVAEMLDPGAALTAWGQDLTKALLHSWNEGFISATPGTVKSAEHHIPTTDTKPCKSSARPTTKPRREEMDGCLDKLLKDGIVQQVPEGCDWGARPEMVPVEGEEETANTWVLCPDYRLLNAKTDTNPEPTQNAAHLLSQLRAAKVFTTLDLPGGVYQMNIAEEDREKTAFFTHLHVFASIYIHLHAFASIYIHLHAFASIHIHLHAYASIYISIYIYLHPDTSFCIHLHVFTFIYMHLHPFICMCIQLHVLAFIYVHYMHLKPPLYTCQICTSNSYFNKSISISISIYIHMHKFATIYTYLHVYASICKHLHVFTSIYMHMHPFKSIYMHMHPFTSICVHLHPFAFIYRHLHAYASIYIHLHAFASIYMHVQPFTCTASASIYIHYMHLYAFASIYM